MTLLVTIFLIIGLLCFMAAAAKFPEPHADRVGWLGLAFWILATIIQQGGAK